MVMVSKEEGRGVSVGVSVGGEYVRSKSKNKWRRRKVRGRNDGMNGSKGGGYGGGVVSFTGNGGYELPRLTELRHHHQHNRRLRSARYRSRKSTRAPPLAPRNTTSFIMRAKKSGGAASLVSPVTPAILPTPALSPAPRYREGLVDQVNREWGVDGYGSMSGLIRLRSMDDSESDDCVGSCVSESEVEQDSHAQSVQQLEQRIDHGVSRFEIAYPGVSRFENVRPYESNALGSRQQPMEVRMEELESQVAHLEDENVSLKENLSLLRQELRDSRRRSRPQDGDGHNGSDENADRRTESSLAPVSCA